jgi:hypothetical protein
VFFGDFVGAGFRGLVFDTPGNAEPRTLTSQDRRAGRVYQLGPADTLGATFRKIERRFFDAEMSLKHLILVVSPVGIEPTTL